MAASLSGVAAYYDRKLAQHGPTPLGVDWACRPTQELRFVQLLKACDFSRPFSLVDLGCGYGALLAFLARRRRVAHVDYLGVDISAAMIDSARRRWKHRDHHVAFAQGRTWPDTCDYAVASGIFNVKLDSSVAAWELHAQDVIAQMYARSRRAAAVNFLAVSPHRPNVRSLYRTRAARWATFGREELGAEVEVLDDYGMDEFTLICRRPQVQADVSLRAVSSRSA